MKIPRSVYVEFVKGQIIRIFRSEVDARLSPAWEENRVGEYPRKDAVEAIRRAVFTRSKGQCEHCGKTLTWTSLNMHERVFRSDGGEQSLENCQALCYDCHEGRKDAEHQRHLKFRDHEPIR